MEFPNSMLKESVDNLMEKSDQEYSDGNYAKSIELLEEAWMALPEPRVLYDESYHIVKYIIYTYLFINKPQDAMDWSDLMFICDLERIDNGEREFIIGKIAYELQRFDKAKELFFVANKKSEGRMFEDEDPKYLKLIKK
ncbi:hypothetical protein HOO54_08885 [Bacillus sp. WMMC1349]|uniref:hypothetical protein n=1 Tax=Bacillus sp. WMMC1349 TaxID=2736254 RepID=UPI001554E07D|nr:hypothetical protein [Bacillus sp. WMMC1349]NPC92334.1 hypothetical protein [Bacillus sp. WMMC1349]